MTGTAYIVTKILSAMTVVGGITTILIALAVIRKKFASGTLQKIALDYGLFGLFLLSVGALVGSLYFSNVIGFSPCVLCWWQRIFMYPQVLILGLATWKKDFSALSYSLLLSATGGIVALYQTYILFGGAHLFPCSAETTSSCSKVFFLEFGYVTIPTMSLTAFALLAIMVVSIMQARNKVE